MSNYKFNGISLSDIVQTDSSPDGSYYTNFKYITDLTATSNSRPLTIPYQINNTSISNITLAQYTLHTSSSPSVACRTSAKHFRVVARGGGGGGGGGSGASSNNVGDPHVKKGAAGKGGTAGDIAVLGKTAINDSNYSITIGNAGSLGNGKAGHRENAYTSSNTSPGGSGNAGGYSEFIGSGVTVKADGGSGGSGGEGRTTNVGGTTINNNHDDDDIDDFSTAGPGTWDNDIISGYGLGSKGGNGGNSNHAGSGYWNANSGDNGVSDNSKGAIQIIWLYE